MLTTIQIDREEKADQSPDQPDPTEQTVQPTSNGTTTPTSSKRRPGTLAAAASRLRSRSRHSAVTDKGQTSSQENLEKISSIAPPMPHAEATPLAPELQRHASSPPSPTINGLSSPGIVISADPASPATLIPSTDGSSTRPTKGGIAYPFSLKVRNGVGLGMNEDANASMVTLDSVGMRTPDAVEGSGEEKQLGAISAAIGGSGEVENGGVEKEEVDEERLYTVAPGMGSGAGLFSSGVQPEMMDSQKVVERPGVERFETAREDLSAIAAGEKK